MAKKEKNNSSIKSNPTKSKDFLTIGIGASAGGIKALREFFAAMPSDSGMAFVVILHLSQTHKSSLAEILQRETKMPVEQVAGTIKVEPNKVYVIPPAKHLEMVDGIIKLKEPPRIKGVRVPIDQFFRTLAIAYGRKAVCIILSGTGSDGTMGMKYIKDRGGFAIIQDPIEAEYDGMPRSAVETKIADVVLPIAAMPEKLLFVRDTTEKFRLTDIDDKEVGLEIKNIDLLRDVLTLLRVRTGHDFSNYKRPTLIRRLARHLQIYETDDLSEYLEILRKKPDEVLSLLKNLLINVTNFFRDKESFDTLQKKVIPSLFKGKGAGDQVRAWIAGCSTGEEAYSLAILLNEYTATLADPPAIQIFASDVDEDAIAEAREGRFTDAAVAEVSPERLQQFFMKEEDDTYRIRKSIREMILFAPHNILRDPPFSRLDLISCRNVLIYLNRETQEQILKVFHFALRDGGYLFLGSSETADSAPNHFSPIDKKCRIYQCRPSGSGWNLPPALPITGVWAPKVQQLSSEARSSLQSFGELHHRLIEHYAPPSVLVNEEGDILHLSESAGRFLRFAGGEPTVNIMKVIHPSLLSDLRAALFTARKENKTVEAKNIRAKFDGDEKCVNIMVRPVGTPEAAALVMFEETAGEPPAEESAQAIIAGDKAMEAVVRRMEDDLKHTKDQLRNTIEQYETSTEELKASNEELQAINEELRSASEELETSKEELQSVNEELTTVNNELKDKVDETTRVNSDLQNLMQSTDIATIFLDRTLQIKRYTPRATEIFNLIPTDLGRPLSHITHRLEPDNFQRDAAKSLQSLQTIEQEVHAADGRFFMARFSPYRTLDDKIEGVVISFINVTDREEAAQLVKEERSYAEAIIATVREPLIILDKDLRVISASPSFYETFEVKPEETEGKFIFDLGNHQWDIPALRRLLEEILPERTEFQDFEVEHTFESIGQRTMLLNAREIRRNEEGRRLILLTISDVSKQRQAELLMEEERAYAEAIVATVREPLIVLDKDLHVVSASQSFYNTFDVKQEETEGRFIYNLGNRQWNIPDLRKLLEEILPQKNQFQNFEVNHEFETIGQRTMLLNAREIRRDDEGRRLILMAIEDITEQKRVMESLRVSEEDARVSEAKYRSLFNSIDEGFHIIELIYNDIGKAVDYRFLEVNQSFERHTGLKNAVGKLGSEIAPNTEDYWFKAYNNVIETGKPVRFENYNEYTGRWFSAYAFRVDGPEDHRVAVLFNDITERKTTEDRQAFLLRLSDMLRPLSDPMEIQMVAARIIGEHLGVSRAFYFGVEKEKGGYVHVVERDFFLKPKVTSLVGRHPQAAFGKEVFTPLAHGQTVVMPNVGTSPLISQEEMERYLALNVQSFVLVPLIKHGEYVAGLVTMHDSPRNWTTVEIGLIEETAQRTWGSVERAKAETALYKSEDRLQLATEAAQIGTFIYYPDEDRGEPDEQMLRLYGLPPDGSLNLSKALSEIIHPDDRQRYGDEMAKALDPLGSGKLETDIRIMHPDHSIRWMNVNAQVIFEGDPPHAVRMPGASTDITGRKQTEEALRRSEANYRIMINQAVAGIIQTDPSGNLIFVNDQFEKMLGYSGDELLHKNLTDLVYEKDRPRHTEMFETIKKDGQPYVIEKRLVHKNGSFIWVNNYNSPIFSEDGHLQSVAIISVDISLQKDMEKQKDDFISVSSHELKTPLTGIRVYADLLQEIFADDEETPHKDLTRKLNAQIHRLAKLVNGLLDTTRISEGQFALQLETFDLNQLLEERISEAQLTSPNHRLILKPGEPSPVYADRERIGQVVTNLVSNAVKYSPEANQVIISSVNINNGVQVNVRDFGIGLQPEDRQKIFERFYRTATSGGSAGLGLGLYISMEIIKMHGGTMGVLDAPTQGTDGMGKGSVFYFTLPNTRNA